MRTKFTPYPIQSDTFTFPLQFGGSMTVPLNGQGCLWQALRKNVTDLNTPPSDPISSITYGLGRKNFNYCHHRRIDSLSPTKVLWDPADEGYMTLCMFAPQFQFDHAIAYELIDIEQAKSIASNLGDSRNVLSDLVEIGEMKGLQRELVTLLSKLVKSSPHDTLASLWLSSELAIKPTIKMVKQYLGLHDAIQKKMAYLQSRTFPTVSFNVSCGTNAVTDNFKYGRVTEGHINYTRERKTNMKLHFVGDLAFSPQEYNLPLVASSMAKFNKPFSAVWNALPLSFVLDWAYGIGEELDKLESANSGNIPLAKNMKPVGISYFTKCNLTNGTLCYDQWNSGRPAPNLSGQLYTRTASIPSLYEYTIDSDWYTDDWKLMTTAALATVFSTSKH